ncbi:MAG: hypothetical protein ACTSXZ_08720 [Alphaproteobacteria bacterium]
MDTTLWSRHRRARLGLRAFAILAMALLPAACVFSKQPLSPPGSYTADTRLVGDWAQKPGKDKDKSKSDRISVRQRDAYTLDVILREFYDGGWHRTDYSATFTDMGDYVAINLGHESKPYGYVYWIITYSWKDDGGLVLWISDSAPLFKAIESGRLQGSIHPGLEDDEVVLTGSSAEVRKALAAIPADELFFWNEGPYYRR